MDPACETRAVKSCAPSGSRDLALFGQARSPNLASLHTGGGGNLLTSVAERSGRRIGGLPDGDLSGFEYARGADEGAME